MKKRARKKSPFPRLILVVLLAAMLFGAGFYAYYKRNAAQGLTLGDTMAQVNAWLVQHKKQLHEGLKIVKKEVPVDHPPQEQVKFEFYDSLANMQVKVDNVTEQTAPANTSVTPPMVTKLQKQKVLASPSPNMIVNPDEMEKEFYEKMKVTK